MAQEGHTVANNKGKQPKDRATKNEKAEILDFVESALVRRLSERQILKLTRERFDMAERTTYRYIADVRSRWTTESLEVDRQERRTHLRKSLEDVYAKSMTATATKPDPDVRSAVRAARLLMDLDALQTPARQIVDVSGTVGVASTTVNTATRAGLEAWLRGDRGERPSKG